MKRIIFVALGLSLGAYLTPASAAKVYVCAISGSLSYSDSPCPIPPTDRTIQAVTANDINDLVINKTLDLLRTATKTKDIQAIERLLSDDFSFVSRDKHWNGRILFDADKSSFIALSRDHLLAMTGYEQVVESQSLKDIDGERFAETRSTETVSLGNKNIQAKLVERILVKVEQGKAKIRSIQQIEL